MLADDWDLKKFNIFNSKAKIVKEELDITPNTFITTLKMEDTAVMLKAEHKNISEVAYAIGCFRSCIFH